MTSCLQAAEERYSREVLAHAESIKTIDNLKEQYSKAQTKARDSLVDAETAQAKLISSETSWKQQKQALEQELNDLNARYDFSFLSSDQSNPHLDARISYHRILFCISISNQSALRRLASNRLPTPQRRWLVVMEMLLTMSTPSCLNCVPSLLICEKRKRSLTFSSNSANKKTFA